MLLQINSSNAIVYPQLFIQRPVILIETYKNIYYIGYIASVLNQDAYIASYQIQPRCE